MKEANKDSNNEFNQNKMSCLQLQQNISDDESTHVTSHDELNSVLYLHPSTMASLSAKEGSYMLVCTDGGHIIVKLSCLHEVKVQCAAFHSSIYKFYEHSTISVIPLQFKTDAAKEVYMYPEKFSQFMVSTDFLEYIMKKMRHIYVRKDLKVNINYLGYDYYFTIRDITPNIPETFENSDVDSKEDNLGANSKEIYEHFDAVKTSTPVSSRKNPARFAGNKAKQLGQEKFYFLHSSSKIILEKSEPEMQISFKDIIALDEVIKFIKFSISSILQSESGLLNIFPKGILLIGPSGSGKSMIGEALKSESCIPVFVVDCQNISSRPKDNNNLERICEKAVSCSPSVIFLDNLDMIFKSDDLKEEIFKSIFFKVLNYASNVLLIASVKNVSLIPSDLRRIGFFEKELYTNISSLGRKQIFQNFLKEYKCRLSETEMNEIIEDTDGFTGGQLLQLCNKAKETFLQDFFSAQDSSISFKNLKLSVEQMKQTVSFNFEIPNVKLCDIGGMKEVKEALMEMIDWPLRLSSQFERFKVTPSKGILMYGPPGCCKTMIAKALVTERNFNFIPVKASELFNKYVGESEKTVSDLFKKARSSTPCILFFDEIDSLTSARNSSSGSSNVTDRILTQLLTEIDGIEPLTGVCILAATNRPETIDPSFLRPGRFDQMIYVPLPDADTRCEIFKVKFRKMPTTADATYLANVTEGYSGAEITEICQLAAKFAIREDAASVSMKHFTQALKEVSPETTAEMIELFEKYEKQRSSHNH